MRLAVSTFVIHDFLALLAKATSAKHAVLSLIAAAAGALLLAGLWTPVAGGVLSLLECWIAFSPEGEFWGSIMAAAIGLGLSMLGPGAWSIDALAYGRRRISIPDR